MAKCGCCYLSKCLNHPRLVVICGFLTATPVADVLGFFFLFGFGPELEIYVFAKVFFSCRLSLAIKCTCLRVGHNWQLPVLIGQGPFFASCACVCWPLDMHVTNTRSRFEWKAFPTFGAALPLFSLAAPKKGLIVESLVTICWKPNLKWNQVERGILFAWLRFGSGKLITSNTQI